MINVDEIKSHIEIYLKVPLCYCCSSEEDGTKLLCEKMVSQIKRHIDNVGLIKVVENRD